jgi:putative transposase
MSNKKYHRVPKDVKADILRRAKEEGVAVAQAAKDAGISEAATDFTELIFHGKKAYVSTILDLFTRQPMDVQIAVRKCAALAVATLAHALFNHPKPIILHSDNGREYAAKAHLDLLHASGITISRSKPGCPRENGYQESFYDKFKVDFGDPNRFDILGELVAEIYRTMREYSHERIHSALKMPPAVFAEQLAA